MRYSQIRDMDITNGEGIGVALFTQGCPFHCKGCFNQETWDFNNGKEWNESKKELILNCMKHEYITRFTILGGEPLIERNIEPLTQLCSEIKKIYPNKKIWLYTGNTFENVKDKYYDLIKLIDVMIDGPFIYDLKDLSLKFKGSSNQRVINVQKSLQNNKIMLY